MSKTGRKELPNNIKVKRLEWQIEALKKTIETTDNAMMIGKVKNSILNREKAIEYLKLGNLGWRELGCKFGFNYFAYYSNNEKYLKKVIKNGR
jgi:hypothetical protein